MMTRSLWWRWPPPFSGPLPVRTSCRSWTVWLTLVKSRPTPGPSSPDSPFQPPCRERTQEHARHPPGGGQSYVAEGRPSGWVRYTAMHGDKTQFAVAWPVLVLTSVAFLALPSFAHAACTDSGAFVLDTRTGNGLTCEWITPTNGQAFGFALPIPLLARITRTADGSPATNASVQVRLYITNSTSYYKADLADNGRAGGDTAVNDGIYGGFLSAPTMMTDGDYHLDLYAGFPPGRMTPVSSGQHRTST
jgi:hypothetical protein